MSQIIEFAPTKPLEGALMVQLVFWMPRSKDHYRTGKFSDLLKPNAPEMHIKKPDGDNLAKLVLDCLEKSGFYKNDSQVCKLQVEKLYVNIGESPRTEVHIEFT